MMNIRINKVAAVIIGVVVLLALSAGATLLVTNHINAHDLAVQRAAAAASHNRTVASAKARAQNKAIAAANRKADNAVRAAKRAARETAPAPVVVQPAAPPAGNSQYVNDILAAGIVAPAGWITATGNTLCQDWNTDGVPVSVTDQTVLEAGGILPQHVATFDAITSADVCS
jgi:predicted ATP-grasp superfamily ATP-dependent carboligase